MQTNGRPRSTVLTPHCLAAVIEIDPQCAGYRTAADTVIPALKRVRAGASEAHPRTVLRPAAVLGPLQRMDRWLPCQTLPSCGSNRRDATMCGVVGRDSVSCGSGTMCPSQLESAASSYIGRRAVPAANRSLQHRSSKRPLSSALAASGRHGSAARHCTSAPSRPVRDDGSAVWSAARAGWYVTVSFPPTRAAHPPMPHAAPLATIC